MKMHVMKNNLLAVGCGILLIILLEVILLFAGVRPLADEDRFVGFSGSTPLFLPVHDLTRNSRIYSVNPAKRIYFNATESFEMPKPPGVFRIVVFGGSTTYGRPYTRQSAFGAWMGRLLEQYGSAGTVEVINCGGISYASYRVRRLMEEMAAYDPDLFVVYSGHNEFLEARTFAALRDEPESLRNIRQHAQKSRIYSVLARLLGKTAGISSGPTVLGDNVEATIERIGGPELYHRDAEFRAGVIRQYRHEIVSMSTFCKERKIPLILSTLPVNLSGISPFKSEHGRQLDGDAVREWYATFRRGLAAQAVGNQRLALDAFAKAEAIDDGYAELHYRKGQVLEQLGDFTQAYRAYDRARQEDIVPLRALDEFNQIVRSIAAIEGIPLADTERMFLRVSPGGITGANLFVDHVHPSIEGHQLVAWVILDAAARAGLVPLDVAAWQQVMPQAREYLREELTKIPARYQAEGLRSVGRLYFWAGKYPEAYAALRKAWQTIKDQPETARQLGELEIMRGDIPAALSYLDAAERLSPGDRKVALARASALNRSGRSEEALVLLRKIEIPDNDQAAGVYHVLGETLWLLGRPVEAAESYRKAVAVAPQVASYRLFLADSLKRASENEAARNAYREYLALLPNPAEAVPVETWLRQP